MGGFGSGGWNCKGRPNLSQCLALRVKAFKKNGLFEKGKKGLLSWGSSTIYYETRWEDMIILTWRNTTEGPEQEQFIGFQYHAHPRNFGGFQTYFLCPKCQKRFTTLYLLQNNFRCRKCHRLPYASQRERPLLRIQRKLEKLCLKLGWQFEWGDICAPPRPKRMRIQTYILAREQFRKLCLQLYQLDAHLWNRTMIRFAKLRKV